MQRVALKFAFPENQNIENKDFATICGPGNFSTLTQGDAKSMGAYGHVIRQMLDPSEKALLAAGPCLYKRSRLAIFQSQSKAIEYAKSENIYLRKYQHLYSALRHKIFKWTGDDYKYNGNLDWIDGPQKPPDVNNGMPIIIQIEGSMDDGLNEGKNENRNDLKSILEKVNMSKSREALDLINLQEALNARDKKNAEKENEQNLFQSPEYIFDRNAVRSASCIDLSDKSIRETVRWEKTRLYNLNEQVANLTKVLQLQKEINNVNMENHDLIQKKLEYEQDLQKEKDKRSDLENIFKELIYISISLNSRAMEAELNHPEPPPQSKGITVLRQVYKTLGPLAFAASDEKKASSFTGLVMQKFTRRIAERVSEEVELKVKRGENRGRMNMLANRIKAGVKATMALKDLGIKKDAHITAPRKSTTIDNKATLQKSSVGILKQKGRMNKVANKVKAGVKAVMALKHSGNADNKHHKDQNENEASSSGSNNVHNLPILDVQDDSNNIVEERPSNRRRSIVNVDNHDSGDVNLPNLTRKSNLKKESQDQTRQHLSLRFDLEPKAD